MNNNVRQWINSDGVRYLQELGLTKGNVILDFGCNAGHYTIPAAKIVGPAGKVYAVDKDDYPLQQLQNVKDIHHIKNIDTINTNGSTKLELKSESVDMALLYDVLHYFYEIQRKSLYKEIYRVLKPKGVLSVYPKHNKQDFPMWSLAQLSIKDIENEIKKVGFILLEKKVENLFHDDYKEQGRVLNFKKVINIKKEVYHARSLCKLQ